MMRLGMIGAGSISGAHLKVVPMIADTVEFVALADPVPAALARQAARFAINRTYTDCEEIFAAKDIDGVVICTPHDTHLGLTLAALHAGKHVLVEKPMACTVQEGQVMVAAAKKAGRTLMVAQCQRYEPAYQKLKEFIDSGELGPLRLARVEAMQSAAAFTAPGHWMLDGKRAGGGIVINVAIHKLDLLRWYLGQVSWVQATTQKAPFPFINDAEDIAVATIGFANGTLAELFSCWNAYRLRYSENIQLFGQNGTVHAVPASDGQIGQPLIASRKRTPAQTTGFAAMFGGFEPVCPDAPNPPSNHAFANQLAHFAACCASGKEPCTSAEDNLGTLQLVEAIYESARKNGTRVFVTPSRASSETL